MTDQEPEVTRDASDVGVACSICSSIDFLPFTCTLCSRTFCKEHSNAAQPAAHDCPAYKSTIVPEHEQNRDGSAAFKSLLPGMTSPEDPSLRDASCDNGLRYTMTDIHNMFISHRPLCEA